MSKYKYELPAVGSLFVQKCFGNDGGKIRAIGTVLFEVKSVFVQKLGDVRGWYIEIEELRALTGRESELKRYGYLPEGDWCITRKQFELGRDCGDIFPYKSGG